MALSRWTGFVFLYPSRYLEECDCYRYMDMEQWSTEEYDWEQDSWNGLKDTAQRPSKTINSGRGDCEDYAVAISSILQSKGHEDLRLVVVGNGLLPDHVICYDAGTETTYSNGNISELTASEWLYQSDYSWMESRKIN